MNSFALRPNLVILHLAMLNSSLFKFYHFFLNVIFNDAFYILRDKILSRGLTSNVPRNKSQRII